MLRRIVTAAIAGTALLAAFGCGSGGGGDASIRSDDGGASRAVSPSAADAGDAPAEGVQTVTYQGLQFDVPADWAVHDLNADPKTCVRFDVNAVYLGHPHADMDCPAGLVGRADAVLIEPTDDSRAGRERSTARSTDQGSDGLATTASGLDVTVAGGDAATPELDATIPSAGVSVTLTYRDTDATAQQILQSFRAVAR